jgi:hypothetical protein
MPASLPTADSPIPRILAGSCSALFAYDIGLAIDLDKAAALFAARFSEATRPTIKKSRRTPEQIDYRPPPLRVSDPCDPIAVGAWSSTPVVELTLFDFGAVSVEYVFPLSGPLTAARELSDALYENAPLLADSRRRVEALMRSIAPAIRLPELVDFVEDYHIFHIAACDHPGVEVVASHRALLAQILRSESETLSEDEVADALSHRVSYAHTDAALIDFNGAILFDDDAADSIAILEFANVELLEMRHLDDRLDMSLADAYRKVNNPPPLFSLFSRRGSREAAHVAALEMDAAMLFESVNNALKLVGDQYLARLYRLSAKRLHLPEWDASILRKLETLGSIYQKLNDRQATRRLEVLEWIVIVLIAAELVLPFILALFR